MTILKSWNNGKIGQVVLFCALFDQNNFIASPRQFWHNIREVSLYVFNDVYM